MKLGNNYCLGHFYSSMKIQAAGIHFFLKKSQYVQIVKMEIFLWELTWENRSETATYAERKHEPMLVSKG